MEVTRENTSRNEFKLCNADDCEGRKWWLEYQHHEVAVFEFLPSEKLVELTIKEYSKEYKIYQVCLDCTTLLMARADAVGMVINKVVGIRSIVDDTVRYATVEDIRLDANLAIELKACIERLEKEQG
jgi:hypothetical protein